MKIVIHPTDNPTPRRDWDFRAYDADTYDADCDEDGYFSTRPVGEGATPREAIANLFDQMDPTDVAVLLAFDEIEGLPA